MENPLWGAPRIHGELLKLGDPGQADCTGLTLAEWLCRTADRIDPA